MSVSLMKGQKVDLTKGNAGLSKVIVGLGWDEVKKSGGFFGSLFGGNSSDIDCDATAFLLTNGKLASSDDVIYYHNLRHSSGSVNHQGDNLTGAGDGDDEQIVVDLPRVPSSYDKIVFTVNIYEARARSQHFGMVENAFIRIVDSASGRELCKYNLSDNYTGKTAMIFGELYRYNGEWKFGAIGEPTNDNSISELAVRYR